MARLARALGFSAAVTLAAGAVSAQATAPQAADDAPIPVAQDAPPGSSGDVAKGAAIGLAIGLVLILLIGASASGPS
jgi:hypothetical protein